MREGHTHTQSDGDIEKVVDRVEQRESEGKR